MRRELRWLPVMGVLLFASSAQALDALSLLACMHANVPPSLRVQDVQLTSTDRNGGSRSLQGRIAATTVHAPSGEILLRSTLQVRAPESYAGAAYLIRETVDGSDPGMYVYLPSVRRVRRVSGSFADGALLGTDFSYNDFKQLQNAFAGATAEADGEELIGTRPSQRLKVQPQASRDAAKGSAYTQVRVWVDQQSCVPVKAQFLRDDKLIKELTVPAAELRSSGKRWYAGLIQMRNVQDGTQSELRVTEVQTPPKLADSLFDPQAFYRPAGL